MIKKLRQWGRRLRREVTALYFASHDPRTPWLAKVLIVCVIAYALSPLDLIPDFIPVLGQLDDLILLPIGIMLVIRLIPSVVWMECREQATLSQLHNMPLMPIAGVVIVGIWIFSAILLIGWLVSIR